jgi:IrrE N-terminal-like domain
MTPLWAHEAAESFWSRTGSRPPPFPRDLRKAIALGLPLAVVDLPGLRLATVQAWLSARDAPLELGTVDRRVHACLVAYAGRGVVFLEGADPDDERRYSLAHEVGHFLLEHDHPRRRASERLGERALEVLDGRRPALTTERVDALLAGVLLSVDVHFLDRNAMGVPEHAAASSAERRAEILALELLAPAEAVQPYVANGLSADEIAAVLTSRFGLPVSLAQLRAQQLVPEQESAGLLERLWLG